MWYFVLGLSQWLKILLEFGGQDAQNPEVYNSVLYNEESMPFPNARGTSIEVVLTMVEAEVHSCWHFQ